MSCYVALDGPDGGGKSTQARELVAWLRASGASVEHVREPGSTPVGEALRQLLLSPASGELQNLTEALLFSAARSELVARVIAPARRRGAVVVAERCYLSTVVYQALASAPGIELEWLFDLTRRVHGEWLPDAVWVLDVAPDVARGRRRARRADRIEQRGEEYEARVRASFLTAARQDARAQVVDASAPFDAVQAELRRLFNQLRA